MRHTFGWRLAKVDDSATRFIQPAKRLVQQNDDGFVDQGARQRQSLTHPFGQLVNSAICHCLHPDSLQCFLSTSGGGVDRCHSGGK